MPPTFQSWAYLALFGLCVTGGLVFALVVVFGLQDAFENAALTRAVLVDSLVMGLGSLALLLLSGWALVNRPARMPHDASIFD